MSLLLYVCTSLCKVLPVDDIYTIIILVSFITNVRPIKIQKMRPLGSSNKYKEGRTLFKKTAVKTVFYVVCVYF